jgi:hypothetical protein
MEEIKPVDDFSDIVIPKTIFVAVYDEDTGKVKSVGPEIAHKDKKSKIVLDDDTALSIIKGDTPLSTCFIDPVTNKLEIVETKTFLKVDDILHRIPDSRFTQIERVDILIKHDQKKQTLAFEMLCKSEKISSSDLNFFITEYNDPNVLYQRIKISKADLIENIVTVEIDQDVSDFSIFTKRVIGTYLNYLIEVV